MLVIIIIINIVKKMFTSGRKWKDVEVQIIIIL